MDSIIAGLNVELEKMDEDISVGFKDNESLVVNEKVCIEMLSFDDVQDIGFRIVFKKAKENVKAIFVLL